MTRATGELKHLELKKKKALTSPEGVGHTVVQSLTCTQAPTNPSSALPPFLKNQLVFYVIWPVSLSHSLQFSGGYPISHRPKKPQTKQTTT